MRKTSLCAAVLTLGALSFSVPAFAQSSPSAPTGSEAPRNQPPKGNVGTSSQQETGGMTSGMKSGSMKSGSMKSGSTKSSATKSSKHKRVQSRKGSGMSTTGMGGRSVQTPGNPNNTGITERSRNLPGKGNIDNSTPPGR